MQKYYVIHKTKAENKALVNLNRQGFKTWSPSLEKNFSKIKKLKNRTFFPGYIFVILDIFSDDWIKFNQPSE